MLTKWFLSLLIQSTLAGSLFANISPIKETPNYELSLVRENNKEIIFIKNGRYEVLSKSFVANVTAYSSSPDETDSTPFHTATGEEVFDGMVACSRDYSFGTYFLIAGRVYYCGDRFNLRLEKLKYNEAPHLDIWMDSKEKAITFGRGYLWALPLKKT